MNRELILQILSVGCIYIGNTLYQWSLEGRKDIDWTHHHLGTFGFYIFCSSILFFVGFFTLAKQIIELAKKNSNNKNSDSSNSNNNIQFFKKIKVSFNLYLISISLLFIFCFLATLLEITKDVGATLVHHGQYNLLVLSGLLLLYTSTFTMWWILLRYFKFKQIIIGFIIFFISLFIIFEIKNAVIKKDWPIGIDGKKFMFFDRNDSKVCRVSNDFIAWPSFIPAGSTWIVAGSRECPKEKGFSNLDYDNILHIDCPLNEISYTTSPTFFEEQKEFGIFTNDFKTFEKQYKSETYQYKGSPVIIKDETVMAKCGNNTEIHFQNVKKVSTHKRASNFNNPTLKFSTNNNNNNNNNNEEIKIKTMNKDEKSKPIDILFLMIDALSRAHFKRALPSTFETLQSIQNKGESKVFQFFRYHSLKPFTDPNTIAMYTGYNSLNYDTQDKNNGLQPSTTKKPFNWEDNPMFFQSFRNDSYVTSWIYGLCEDWFQAYLKVDKPENSIDHELVLPFCSPLAFPLERPFGIFEGPYSIRRRCLGNKHIHDKIFDYINQFWDNYYDVGKIVTATFMDAHEGTMEVIGIADKQFNRFIKNDMEENLNDTVLFLVGDHGSHMGPYYMWAEGGSIEVSMPILYIVLPTWFTNKYPHVEKYLLENENKLASPFQLYDTIRTLSTFPEFGGIDVFDPTGQKRKQTKGLLGPIPNDISCLDLGIPHDFCQCKNK
ncbi:hypothetical protein RB653_001048 [Dictyostelium firmibasis]|uniref:Uncharacterized protein n=1 Tax=Dictyostelium firmibasis TaxID=79012 RepID=A0AAN7U4D5_9MYCE